MPAPVGPPVVPVDDPDDGRLADYRDLTDAGLRRRRELGVGRHGIFVGEGVYVIRHLLRSGHRLRSLLLTPERAAALAPDLDGVDAPVYVAGRDVLHRVAGFDVHRGALAVAYRPPPADPGALLAAASRVAVLEAVSDHENLGALFRSAAALGIDAVLLCPRCCDPFYRRAVRVSMGHVLSLPFAVVDPWPEGLARVQGAGFTVLALTPQGPADPIDEVEVADGERVAVLLGAEGPGLTAEALAGAHRRVRIPMAPGVDSLNVAAAAAIAFHRLGRPEG